MTAAAMILAESAIRYRESPNNVFWRYRSRHPFRRPKIDYTNSALALLYCRGLEFGR